MPARTLLLGSCSAWIEADRLSDRVDIWPIWRFIAGRPELNGNSVSARFGQEVLFPITELV